MINKKYIVSIICLLFTFLNLTEAEYNNYNDDNILKYTNDIVVIWDRDAQTIKLEWTKSKSDFFQYYKVMKSESDSNPTYPRLSATEVITDINKNYANLTVKSSNDAYYRVCTVVYENKIKTVYCSQNVLKIEWYKGENNTTEDNYTTTKITNESSLSYILQKKADTLINNYKYQLDKKYDNNNIKIEKLNKLKTWLIEIKTKYPKYSELVKYMISKIEKIYSEYDDSFNEIESLFKDL